MAGEYRFLLRHHAESLVQICNNLTVAVDKVAVDPADGILIGLLTATQFIDFFLIHWFFRPFVMIVVGKHPISSDVYPVVCRA